MKQLMYLCLLACLFTSFAFAQKITNQNLQGNWKMTAFNADGIELNLLTQEVTISPEMQAQLTPEAVTGIKEGMKQAVQPLSGSSVIFKGTNMKLTVATDVETGDFKITEKDGRQALTVKNPDGTTSDLPVVMKDKKLYLTLSDKGQSADFIFVKE